MSAKSISREMDSSWPATDSLPTLSTLVTSATIGVLSSRSWLTMNLSPGPIFSSAGTQNPTTSTSAHVVRTTSLSRSPSRVRGRCRPGVSTRTSCPWGRCRMPRIAWRVVWGRDEVIATFVPTSAFVSVDLPTLGRPTKHANPDRNPSGSSAGVELPCAPSPSGGVNGLALQPRHDLSADRQGRGGGRGGRVEHVQHARPRGAVPVLHEQEVVDQRPVRPDRLRPHAGTAGDGPRGAPGVGGGAGPPPPPPRGPRPGPPGTG